MEGHGPESQIEGSGEIHLTVEEAEAYAKELEEKQKELLKQNKGASG